ncbi:MAG: SWIM zinc finger family protein [Paludisphaera borealis]|uniref:SWIM zinc finger family protein n=1 Tax=Paludisphaera borealis TaxID=1387353 RepID=UPI00284105C1|nr:SWIM zinc finger family protein [Paludisphaera borealis]MDR3619129.1 SWIM zinc finger family protein [Paludisphaera borealis]
MSGRWGWDDWGHPRSRPVKAEGGIKSQSKRGAFGESWWAKRWIQVLEGFDIGARLARGRSYARKGQVLSITIANGKVTAKVQGSRPQPYNVTIEVKTLSKSDWAKVLDALGRQALFAAKLLAGEMPQEIEDVFTEVGLSLFPAKLGDLKTDCSCPDWSNPCKHIAAVYYLLGEEFDRDPFLIFALRGLDREALTSRLGAAPPAPVTAPRPVEPLNARAETFWGESGARIKDSLGAVEIPREPAALARRLGGFPFWRGETPFLDALSPIYASASPRGLDMLLGPAARTE